MRTYRTGDDVPYGFYVSPRQLDLVHTGVAGQRLEGKPGATYRRIPTWLMVLASPVFGGAFVLLFPMLVLGALLWGVGVTLGKVAKAVGRQLTAPAAQVGRVRWAPATVYLQDQGEAQEPNPAAVEPEAQDPLADLDAQVAARREGES